MGSLREVWSGNAHRAASRVAVVAVCWQDPCWHSLFVGSWGAAEPGAAGIPLSGPRDPGSLLAHILPVEAATWMMEGP